MKTIKRYFSFWIALKILPRFIFGACKTALLIFLVLYGARKIQNMKGGQ